MRREKKVTVSCCKSSHMYEATHTPETTDSKPYETRYFYRKEEVDKFMKNKKAYEWYIEKCKGWMSDWLIDSIISSNKKEAFLAIIIDPEYEMYGDVCRGIFDKAYPLQGP